MDDRKAANATLITAIINQKTYRQVITEHKYRINRICYEDATRKLM